MTIPAEGLLADTRNQVHDVIATIMPALPRAQIDDTRHLKDLGADSVDRVEIIMLLRERLGLSAPMSLFGDVPHIGGLVALLARLRGEAA